MPAVPADLTVSSRWILPMTSSRELLENHTVVIRDGRILDLLPTAVAAARYAPALQVDRSAHLLMPGLVNPSTRIAPPPERAVAADRLSDGANLCIARMLEAGTTCFGSAGFFPQESARAATEQGMRAVIGIPIADKASPWAADPAQYLTRALNFRDEYRGHPTIATAFAPLSPATLSDATFARIATLADELDAGIVMGLHESRAAVDESVIRHGERPIKRLQGLGLLTPALTAVSMAAVNGADLELAQRSGIAIVLCPESSLWSEDGVPPVASWAASGLRLGVGSGPGGLDGGPEGGACPGGTNPWTAMKLLALLSMAPQAGVAGHPRAALRAWDALDMATRGGAAALGLDAEIGTLERGKWADLCCIDLERPSSPWAAPEGAADAATGLVFNGGRDLVRDVWVAGRHLVNGRAFTRLDWQRAAARLNTRLRRSSETD